MITRRQGREWALQALVQFDINPPLDIDDAISALWDQLAAVEQDAIDEGEFGAQHVFSIKGKRNLATLARMKEFAECRIRGAWNDRDRIDEAIAPCLSNWKIYRLGYVERATLRLGAWEMMNCPDIPAAIIINEAVDLVKYFSCNKSGRFVNGVLDRLAKNLASNQEKSS